MQKSEMGGSSSVSLPEYWALAEDVRWFSGSITALMFGRLALDQVAYREVAAAVDRSGRFSENFTDRGLRTAAFQCLMSFGDASDCDLYRKKLKEQHRAVRGSGKESFADTRYSALEPATWKWTAVSAINIVYQGYLRVCGRHLSDTEKEVVYQVLRSEFGHLE
ncbi:DUF2236 domain-containing protein, partial [Mycobacteroides abscessus subsp. massiliense]|uniref:oxygenase MpaB family protein n=1 Tax=Mycobacteroides abscessus TaxID=36809 RepID=UPI000FA673BB